MRKLFIALLLFAGVALSAQTRPPYETHFVVSRDTCDIFLDIYPPAPGSQTTFEGIQKPYIMYVFGGGFIIGSRDDSYMFPWFDLLTKEGYGVISVDYRLGLKGRNMKFDLFHLLDAADKTKHAVDIGVEDVFACVRYVCDHAEELGVDPSNMVLSGSSAGAMITLSGILETCSPTVRTAVLPEGFRFKGAMSFAGAIMSETGTPSYEVAPPPQLLFHGCEDGAVNCFKRTFGRWGFWGSFSLVEDIYSKKGYTYSLYRYVGHSHDIAAHMVATWNEQKRFLEVNVIKGLPLVIDCTLDDPMVPHMKSLTLSLSDIYQ